MSRILVIGAFVSAMVVGPAAVAQSSRLAILMPGAGGATPIDFVVRNESRIRDAGIDTLVTTSPDEAANVTRAEMGKKRKVVIVGMSRGALGIARALKAGARPSGVVFVSGGLDRARNILGSPAALPRTLVIHHRRDQCSNTSPESARSFVAWSGGRARLRWVDTKGEPSNNPCGPRGAHGYFMQDGAAVSAIVSFVRSR